MRCDIATDFVRFYEQASRHFCDLAAQIGTDQWSAPTPCSEWDVRALVDHVVRGNLAVAPVLDGLPLAELGRLDIARPDFDVLADDPLTVVRHSVDVAVEAFSRPGVLDTVVHHPAGDMRGWRLAGLCFNDNLVHSWDLAQAIGLDATLDPVLVEAAHAYLAPVAGSLPARYFAAMPDVGPTTDRQTELLALLGRDASAWNQAR
ncbi:TIGR03086 family metal-binding protein [Solwaraspora sp. WMMA2080]|uniref:TIGR03086 family metal-binding protein n=1 Tax=unclassified Solwaraspora TaxID=2627926 RepID=UPI00248C9D2B|nr:MULTISPECIES: TIGR03086 family metal-binding protein [unclassified Solwaraspora]WBB97855.1 TIGR03086 family metal-binding protein [Solwaraspora sp. WMMA2059]WBC23585.1 TIGR03086 family metal-binding protein [Solwaraspora sp. WMMA2080]